MVDFSWDGIARMNYKTRKCMVNLGIIAGNLELNNATAVFLGMVSIGFLGSFVFISQKNDMVGALLSLLPKRGKGPLPGPDESLKN